MSTLESSLDLSIIIVNFRSWDPLQQCLDGLAPLPRLSEPDVEIIVVDNASNDGQLDSFKARFDTVQFVENQCNAGFASACNFGARKAQGKELLFLNPDVQATPEAITSFLKVKLASTGLRILTVAQCDAKGRRQRVFDNFPTNSNTLGLVRPFLRMISPRRFPDARQIQSPLLEVDWVSGSALMIDREAYDALNGWDERYWMYYEDVDLCKRAAQRGFRRGFTSTIEITHTHGGASRINPETRALTRAEVIQSRHLYGQLHLRGGRLILWHLLTATTRSLSRVLTGLWGWASAERKAQYRILCRYYARVWKTGNWMSNQAINTRIGKSSKACS